MQIQQNTATKNLNKLQCNLLQVAVTHIMCVSYDLLNDADCVNAMQLVAQLQQMHIMLLQNNNIAYANAAHVMQQIQHYANTYSNYSTANAVTAAYDELNLQMQQIHNTFAFYI